MRRTLNILKKIIRAPISTYTYKNCRKGKKSNKQVIIKDKEAALEMEASHLVHYLKVT
jgi:hypothetical protein